MWTPLLPVWSKSAAKQLAKLPSDIRARLEAAVNRYALTGEGHVLTLQGRSGLRLRVAEYRVIFEILVASRVMGIERVGHRRDIYD